MFVGRERELAKLDRLFEQETFQMVVVYGRRRVGKTTLISEFAKDKRTLFFTALDQADQDNLADFSTCIWDFFGIQGVGPFSSWSKAFDYLAECGRQERFVLVFDEFPYAAKRNSSIPSALQIAIDHGFKSTGIFMVLCGSNQGFMESEVLGRKSPLYGRRTAQMKIGQLGFRDAARMLPGLSPQEQFRFYGCLGGVPYYLEQVNRNLGLMENLTNLYFDATGFLYDEPFGLLRQELRDPALYNSILRAIAGGANRVSLIADRTGLPPTSLPRHLGTLIDLGVIERAVPFGENPETSKKSIYQIKDACYDFWFTFVMPHISEIERGLGEVVARRLLEQSLDDYLGHRFERLCSEWLVGQATLGKLPLAVTEVGPWWGTNPKLRERDDIDIVAADTFTHDAMICECKYRESFDESEVLSKLESRRGLVRGYTATHVAIFSKHALSEGTRAKVAARDDAMSVTLDSMYEGDG